MFFVCFLFSFALSFLFFLFSFYYKKRLHKQQHPQDEQGKSQNEPALSNPSLSHKNGQTRENDSTHFPHSLLLEILPPDSTQWADLFTGESHPREETRQVGSVGEGDLFESQSAKKKKKRGKKKRLDSKGEEENEEDRKKREEPGQSCSGSQVKPQLVCLYPFTSTSSATQRKIKQQYDQLVKCHGNKGLTLAQNTLAGFTKLSSTLSNLEMLDLKYNYLNDSILLSLSELSSLRYLDLSYNRIEGSSHSRGNLSMVRF